MELSEKIGRILNVIKLGMDLPAAFILAECTLEEQEAIEADPSFQLKVQFSQKKLEEDILEKFKNAMHGNLMAGNTSDARWLLERLNRERFGSSSKVTETSTGAGETNVHIYIPNNGRDVQ